MCPPQAYVVLALSFPFRHAKDQTHSLWHSREATELHTKIATCWDSPGCLRMLSGRVTDQTPPLNNGCSGPRCPATLNWNKWSIAEGRSSSFLPGWLKEAPRDIARSTVVKECSTVYEKPQQSPPFRPHWMKRPLGTLTAGGGWAHWLEVIALGSTTRLPCCV